MALSNHRWRHSMLITTNNWALHLSTHRWRPKHLNSLSLRIAYLQHDKTYLIDALGNLLSAATQSNRTLRGVWQHFAGHLYGAACGLAYFLNLWATLSWMSQPINEVNRQQDKERGRERETKLVHILTLYIFSLYIYTHQLTIHIDWRAQSIEWVFEFYQLCQHHWTASTTETGFKLVMWSVS